MKKNQSIGLLEARMNRLEKSKKANHTICRKIRRRIERLKKETETERNTYKSRNKAV